MSQAHQYTQLTNCFWFGMRDHADRRPTQLPWLAVVNDAPVQEKPETLIWPKPQPSELTEGLQSPENPPDAPH